MPPLLNFDRIDAGSLLDRGEDPRPIIVAAVREMPPNRGVLVSAPFLPAPLVELLGASGVATKVERGERGNWFVYFWRGDV